MSREDLHPRGRDFIETLSLEPGKYRQAISAQLGPEQFRSSNQLCFDKPRA